MENEIKPTVGMGVTRRIGSDRYPFTVWEVRSPTCIVVKEDLATRNDSNGESECQTYLFSTDASAPDVVLTKRRDGSWKSRGGAVPGTFKIGKRSRFHDYTV